MTNKPTRIATDPKRMTKGVSASGTPSLNCGDDVASALAGLPIDKIKDIARELGVGYDDEGNWKYERSSNGKLMSPGHQRMVIGHVFRRLVRDKNRDIKKFLELASEFDVETTPVVSGDEWFRGVISRVAGK